MNRSFKIFLTLSVIVNLLLAGMVVGIVGRNFVDVSGHHTMPPAPESVKNLSPEKRAAFEQAMTQVNKDTEQLRDELHDAHKKLGEIIKAETFDKDAYLKQMQRVHELHGKLADHMAQAIATLAGQWGPEDRATLADAVRGPMMPPPPEKAPPPLGDEPPPPPAN